MKSIDNGSTTTFVYNGLGQVARRNGSPWGPYIDYAWDAAGHQLGTYLNGWANQMIYAGDSELAYDFGSRYFIHRNALGSNSMITNYSGGVYSDALFYPWGQIWQTGDAGMSYFAGFMRYEGDLGIYTPVNRSYNPRLGRWPSPDPLGGDVSNPQSLNRYAYVVNNPTTLIDPLGLQCEDARRHCPPVQASPTDPGCSLNGISGVPCSAVAGALSAGAAFPVGVPPSANLTFQSGNTFVYSWQEAPPNGYVPCPSGAAGCFKPNGDADVTWWAQDHIDTGTFTLPNTPVISVGTPGSTPVIKPASGKFSPNVPPVWGYCSAYRDGTGAGETLYQICMHTPNGAWSNCVRGKLLNQFVPNDNPPDLIFRYGFADHFYDFTTCLGR